MVFLSCKNLVRSCRLCTLFLRQLKSIDGLPWGECKIGGWEEGREDRMEGKRRVKEVGGERQKEKRKMKLNAVCVGKYVRVWQWVLLPQIKLQQLQPQCNQIHAHLSLLDDVDCSEDENDFHTPPENKYHLQDSDQCSIFPLCQFSFGQLPTSSIPTSSFPIWSMLTKWELTEWE